MRSGSGSAWLISIVVLTVVTGASSWAQSPGGDEAAIRRALALLPGRAPVVSIIDAEESNPETRQTLMKLDAFITRGGHVVYVVKQSAVLHRATKGSQLYDYMLASIIWHEMAHIDGADEPAARRAEEQLWIRFVRDGVVDQVTALRYLKALTSRGY